MTDSPQTLSLPAKPNLERLRKEAKQRLAVLRGTSASVQLTDAQLLVARRYGFSSWRAMKLEVEHRASSLGADVLPPPLSVVFRPQASGTPRHRFSPLQDSTQLELSFFPATAVGIGFVQGITMVATLVAMLH